MYDVSVYTIYYHVSATRFWFYLSYLNIKAYWVFRKQKETALSVVKLAAWCICVVMLLLLLTSDITPLIP